MNMKKQFYYCEICGNIVEKVEDSGNMLTCCSKTMRELESGTTDGKVEWHVPVCKVDGNTVTVEIGENPHPMEDDHHIEWIELVTDRGVYRRYLKVGEKPCVKFTLADDEKACCAYAHCNKHKLYKSECK